jgi:hypothetical protein
LGGIKEGAKVCAFILAAASALDQAQANLNSKVLYTTRIIPCSVNYSTDLTKWHCATIRLLPLKNWGRLKGFLKAKICLGGNTSLS